MFMRTILAIFPIVFGGSVNASQSVDCGIVLDQLLQKALVVGAKSDTPAINDLNRDKLEFLERCVSSSADVAFARICGQSRHGNEHAARHLALRLSDSEVCSEFAPRTCVGQPFTVVSNIDYSTFDLTGEKACVTVRGRQVLSRR